MIRVLGFSSSRSTSILWALEEASADYEYKEVNRRHRHRNEELTRVSPLGKVPVLVDDDIRISETIAIIDYIDFRFPEANLIPQQGANRWKYRSLASFCVTELEQPLWLKAKHRYVLPKELRVQGLDPSIEWEFKRNLKVLADWLKDQEFMLGDDFSAADILVTQSFVWAQNAGLSIEDENVIHYRDRLLARPSYLRAVEREKSALAGA